MQPLPPSIININMTGAEATIGRTRIPGQARDPAVVELEREVRELKATNDTHVRELQKLSDQFPNVAQVGLPSIFLQDLLSMGPNDLPFILPHKFPNVGHDDLPVVLL